MLEIAKKLDESKKLHSNNALDSDATPYANPIAQMMYNREQQNDFLRGSRPFNIDENERFKIKRINDDTNQGYDPLLMRELTTNIFNYNNNIESFLLRIKSLFVTISNYDNQISSLVELNKSFIDNNVKKQEELLRSLNLSRNNLDVTLNLEKANEQFKNFLSSCKTDLDIFFQAFGKGGDGNTSLPSSSLVVPIEEIENLLNDKSISRSDYIELNKHMSDANGFLANILANQSLNDSMINENRSNIQNLVNVTSTTSSNLDKIIGTLSALDGSQVSLLNSIDSKYAQTQAAIISSLELGINKVLNKLDENEIKDSKSILDNLSGVKGEMNILKQQNLDLSNNLKPILNNMLTKLDNPYNVELIKLSEALATSNSAAIIQMTNTVSESLKPLFNNIATQVEANRRLEKLINSLRLEKQIITRKARNVNVPVVANTFATSSMTAVPITDENGMALQGIQDNNMIMDTSELNQEKEREERPNYSDASILGSNEYIAYDRDEPPPPGTSSVDKITPVSSAYNGLPGQPKSVNLNNLATLPIPKDELNDILNTINDSWRVQFEFFNNKQRDESLVINKSITDLISGMQATNDYSELEKKYQSYIQTVLTQQYAHIENIITRVENNFVVKYEEVTRAYKESLQSGLWSINPKTNNFILLEKFSEEIGSFSVKNKAIIKDDVIQPLVAQLGVIADNINTVSKSEQAVQESMKTTNEALKKEISDLNQNILILANNIKPTPELIAMGTQLTEILNSLKTNTESTGTISTTVQEISTQVSSLNALALEIKANTNIVPIVNFISPVEGGPPPDGSSSQGNVAQILDDIQKESEFSANNVLNQENPNYTVSASSQIILGEHIVSTITPVDLNQQSESSQTRNDQANNGTISTLIPESSFNDVTPKDTSIEIDPSQKIKIKPYFESYREGVKKISRDKIKAKELSEEQVQKQLDSRAKYIERGVINYDILRRALKSYGEDFTNKDVKEIMNYINNPTEGKMKLKNNLVAVAQDVVEKIQNNRSNLDRINKIKSNVEVASEFAQVYNQRNEKTLMDYNDQQMSTNDDQQLPVLNDQNQSSQPIEEEQRVGSGIPKCSGCGKQDLESLSVHEEDPSDVNCSECLSKRGGMTVKRKIADSDSMIPIKKHKSYSKAIKKQEEDKKNENIRQQRIATSSLQYYDLEASKYFDNMNWFTRYSKSFVVNKDLLPNDALKRLAYIMGVAEHAPHRINSNLKANFNALSIRYLEKHNISNPNYFVPNADKFDSFAEILRYIQQEPNILYNYLL